MEQMNRFSVLLELWPMACPPKMNNFPLVGGSVFSISAIFMACVFNVSKHFGVAVNWNFRNNALISLNYSRNSI